MRCRERIGKVSIKYRYYFIYLNIIKISYTCLISIKRVLVLCKYRRSIGTHGCPPRRHVKTPAINQQMSRGRSPLARRAFNARTPCARGVAEPRWGAARDGRRRGSRLGASLAGPPPRCLSPAVRSAAIHASLPGAADGARCHRTPTHGGLGSHPINTKT